MIKHRNYKLILLTGAVFFLSFSVASAKNFTIFNATNVNQPYFSVDGTTGNVGIGTTTPLTTLNVIGKWQFNDAGILYNQDSSRWLDLAGINGDSLKVPFNILTTDGMLASDLTGSAQIRLKSAGTYFGKIQNDNSNVWSLAYSTASSSVLGTPALSWNSSGNVGIGTTNPGASKLSVEINNSNTDFNTSNYPLKLRNTAWSGNQVTGIEFWNGVQKVVPTARIISQMNGSGSGGENLYFQTQPSSGLNPNPNQPTTKLTILADGNVGIGIALPTKKLDIDGDLLVRNAATFGSSITLSSMVNSGNRILMIDNNGVLYSTSSSIATGLPSPSGISGQTLRSDGTSWVANSLLYNNGTNVGIGTTTPGSYKLNVVGNIKANSINLNYTDAISIRAINGENYKYINANDGHSGYYALRYISNGGDADYDVMHQFLTNKGGISNTPIVSFTRGGSVGIGTTTPGSLLTIGNNLGLTLGGTIYGALASRYLDFTGVLPLSLSVPGPIKFGNTASACDGTNTGALRYDAISGQSYLCDGSRWVNQKNCGLMTDDEGRSYNTVQIGGQCWMAENINIGTMLASGSTMPNTGDQVIEKWCYNSDPANCATNGGLYHFDEAVRGSKVSGARGICPAGWHVPTDAEFNVLEKTVSGIIASAATQYPCNLSVTGWRRCADDNAADNGGPTGVGKSLKAVGVGGGNGAGNNLVGFEGKLSGYRDTDSSFYALGSYLFLWSSSPSGSSYAWARPLPSSYSTVYRDAYTRAYGFSVRCVRD